MIEVERYSIEGFKPQYQSHHLAINMFEINNIEKMYTDLGLPLPYETYQDFLNKIEFRKENLQDFKYGIWVFISGYKNNQALNHLKVKVPCWIAELPEDTIVYDVNWTKKMKLKDDECKYFGCYIPKRNLKEISNIHKKKKKA